MDVDGWIDGDGWMDGWMTDGEIHWVWRLRWRCQLSCNLLSLKLFPVLCLELGMPCPKVTQRGRTGICISTRVSRDAEAGCEDVSNWRSLTEKMLSSGGIKSSLRSGKKPQLITRAK